MERLSIYQRAITGFGAPVLAYLATALIMNLLLVLSDGVGIVGQLNQVGYMRLVALDRLTSIVAQAVPYFFAGLAAAIAFQAGVFNLGIEGQYFIGGLTGAVVGIYLPVPAVIHIPVIVVSAMLGGALWASIIAGFKRAFGVPEFIVGLILNGIAIPLSRFVGTTLLGAEHVIGVASSAPVRASARFFSLSPSLRSIGLPVSDASTLDITVIIAIVIGLIVYLIIYNHSIGFSLRATGIAPRAAAAAGMRTGRIYFFSLFISGAIAGLIGVREIFAIRGSWPYDLQVGFGIIALFIAAISRNNPLAIGLVSLLVSSIISLSAELEIYLFATVNYYTGLQFLSLFILITYLLRSGLEILFERQKT